MKVRLAATVLLTCVGGLYAQKSGPLHSYPELQPTYLHAGAAEGGSPIYAGTDKGLFVSTDEGRTWIHNQCLGYRAVQAVNIRLGDKITLFVAADGSLFRSTDGGASWELGASPTALGITRIVPDPAAADRIYAGGRDLLISLDDGQQWSRIPSVPPSTEYRIDPFNASNLYSAAPGSVSRSTDGGKTWSLSLSTSQVGRLVMSKDGSHLYAYGGGAVYRSIDRGDGWLELVLSKSFLAAAAGYGWSGYVDPEDPVDGVGRNFTDVSFDPVDQFSAYVTADVWWNGEWSDVPRSIAVVHVDGAGVAARADRAFAGGRFTFTAHQASPGVIFRYGPGMDRSKDGGRTWEPIVEFTSMIVYTLLIVPPQSNTPF